jgi:hypothetical protein
VPQITHALVSSTRVPTTRRSAPRIPQTRKDVPKLDRSSFIQLFYQRHLVYFESKCQPNAVSPFVLPPKATTLGNLRRPPRLRAQHLLPQLSRLSATSCTPSFPQKSQKFFSLNSSRSTIFKLKPHPLFPISPDSAIISTPP